MQPKRETGFRNDGCPHCREAAKGVVIDFFPSFPFFALASPLFASDKIKRNKMCGIHGYHEPPLLARDRSVSMRSSSFSTAKDDERSRK